MIVTDSITINCTAYTRKYSDKRCYIRKVSTGELYESAIDPAEREYTETDESIPQSELTESDKDSIIMAQAAALAELGVSVDV